MDVRRIEYFVAVAEHLNFSKAAEELHISHQALSKQIQLLEGELGEKLMERTTTRVSLTKVGAKVYAVFKPLLQELRYGYTEVLDFIEQKQHSLRVGYFNGLSYSRMILPILRWIEGQAPTVQVEIMATDMDRVRIMLEKDEIDLAIFTTFEETVGKDVVCFPIYHSPMKIIVSRLHPWYDKEVLTMEDLAEGQLLAFKNRPTAGGGAFLPELQVGRRILVDNFDTYMGILRRGEAFGFLGDTYSRREGEYKFFDSPLPYETNCYVAVAFKRLHPLGHVMTTLQQFQLDQD